ncbi:molting protein mlt-4 [Anaeramoeba ignava]|uniref:Molting protein mlt-4 n=1 Tax=Anaeramoeba ignava TaxID=1746090 RepID=A0A9Q0RE94_ANAIG|nr:molting protein mlt-4 [Anaeramoeba ignava]
MKKVNFTQKEVEDFFTKEIFPKRDHNENIILHFICSEESIKKITKEIIYKQKLLWQKMLMIKNKFEQTPFLLSFKNPNFSIELFSLFQELGLKFDEYDSSKSTPLHYLCQNKNIQKEMLLNLISESKNIQNLKDKFGNQPLHLLTQNSSVSSLETLQIYIENLNGINCLNSSGNSPFLYACRNDSFSEEMIGYLIQKNSNINQINFRGENCLHFFMERHNYSFKILKILLENGADPSTINLSSNSPLHFAFSNKNDISVEIVKLILDFVPKNKLVEFINLQNGIGYSHLHSLVSAEETNMETLNLLVSSGADINAQTKKNQNCLHLIMQKKKVEQKIIQFFIDLGIDVNKMDINKNTPLYLLFQNDNMSNEVVEFLIGKKAQTNLSNINNQNSLHLVCRNIHNNISVLKLLIETGAQINQKDSSGSTPLLIACYSQPIEVLEFLLQSGSDVNTKNKEKNFPLKILFLHQEKQSRIETKKIKTLLAYDIDIRMIEELISSRNHFSFLSQRIDPKLESLFKTYYHIYEDMNQLLERKEFTDFDIFCGNNQVIPLHYQILSLRLSEENEPIEKITFRLNKLKQEMEHISLEKALIFFKFIYSGFIDHSQKLHLELIESICQKIAFPNWISKKGRKGLLIDLNRLFQQEETKDFAIISEDEKTKILVHKIILIARSELFRALFLTVKDDSNQVKDYCNRSSESLYHLFKFFYLDHIDENISLDIIQNLEDAQEFYQLNENSSLNFQLKEIKESNEEK